MNHFVFVITSLFLFLSCKKNELKSPVNINIDIVVDTNLSSEKGLQFQEGFINLSMVSIDGDRSNADDIYLEKTFDDGYLSSFKESIEGKLSFDLLGGQYHVLKIKFESSDDQDHIPLTLYGSFKNGDKTYPLVCEFDFEEEFEGIISDFTLESSSSYTLRAILAPIHWFSTISYSALQNATLTNKNGVQTLIVSEESNEEIYDHIEDEIDQSFTVTLMKN